MKKITVIGGDARFKTVKKILLEKGFIVDSLGLYENDTADIASSDVLLLPVPSTRDGVTVFAPLTKQKILLKEIKALAKDRLILCCNCQMEGCNLIDYGALDSYALLNAVPTAEGAIKLAVENTLFTLFKSKVLVIGCGRVGLILAQRLKALGAAVTVSARKQKDFALLDALGFSYTHTEAINSKPLDYDIIFNTVDCEVLNHASLDSAKAAFLLDLSSKGGFDLEYAQHIGINALKAPSLPAIYSPLTAGEILAQTVLTLI